MNPSSSSEVGIGSGGTPACIPSRKTCGWLVGWSYGWSALLAVTPYLLALGLAALCALA
eukprot:CAMPEP_0198235294 /NCGR_PEP_ID=MMETSP1446-20131203/1199_1 /TAXON_ID=1461542 ORGANISM="Unidentified sp, Strain CCMP2111" /NCGR_SAMPLE_ID=MMETSP1446 /ASSEMBLY_ACC=CAM_ASM_001112 /LENGTH=58 /DNA_ID=CAMNT_0043916401 /DNA_START=77 /DNA_END=250 /DNA_ORIENTATION=-